MSNLPEANNPETFVGEFEEMDLSTLKDHQFGVAVGLGDRKSARFACSTLMAPLDFYEMVEAVAMIWQNEQMHAKAFSLKKERGHAMEMLDECTIDFIEAKYVDILAEMIILEEKVYTSRAKTIEASDDEREKSA